MLGVTSQREWHAAVSARITEYVDQAEVVTCGNVHTVFRAINTVHVRTIAASGEDAVDVPAELDVLSCPLGSGRVGLAARILLAISFGINCPVEKFVGSAVGSDVCAVTAPV